MIPWMKKRTSEIVEKIIAALVFNSKLNNVSFFMINGNSLLSPKFIRGRPKSTARRC